MLAIGDYAPTLSIPTDTDMFSLTKQGGKKVVVFFFPRADTPGCTKEAEQFSALHDEFAAQNTVVIGGSNVEVGNLTLLSQANDIDDAPHRLSIAEINGDPALVDNVFTVELKGKKGELKLISSYKEVDNFK